MRELKKPACELANAGAPKPILNAYRTQITSTTENVRNVSIIELMLQRFCITPPYSTTRPGTLIRPTSVAAVTCQAVSPWFSQGSASVGIHLLLLLEGIVRARDRGLDPLIKLTLRRLLYAGIPSYGP